MVVFVFSMPRSLLGEIEQCRGRQSRLLLRTEFALLEGGELALLLHRKFFVH